MGFITTIKIWSPVTQLLQEIKETHKYSKMDTASAILLDALGNREQLKNTLIYWFNTPEEEAELTALKLSVKAKKLKRELLETA